MSNFSRFKRSNPSSNERYEGQHRFEHWYRDNTVYFITARCRDGFAAFESEQAKAVFWDRFNHWTSKHDFEPWVTSLLNNHYHTIGYLKDGNELGQMMRKIHGSVAKLVNDTLATRHLPFWREDEHNDYFDGCIRDVLQLDRAYRYTRDQAVRARLVRNHADYAHTHLRLGLLEAIERATVLKVFLAEVPYQRYERRTHRR